MWIVSDLDAGSDGGRREGGTGFRRRGVLCGSEDVFAAMAVLYYMSWNKEKSLWMCIFGCSQLHHR